MFSEYIYFIYCDHILATCKYPILNGSSLYILDASGLAVVGTIIAFSCSKPGEVIIGANASTCLDNGKWEPDPNQVQLDCKDIIICVLL
jgi:hypothetical protein